MLKHWPALSALRGFEAAARLGSFHKAAQELHLTQSAVSQQIRSLEQYLEQPLFERIGRRIALTDAGADLLSTTQQLLQQLATGIRRLEQYRKPHQVIVNTTPAFARHWLLPRLDAFRAQFPEIDLWLLTTDEPPDMAEQTIDLAIRDDIDEQPACHFLPLLQDRLYPACHPRLLQVPAAQRFTLHGERIMDWAQWQLQGGEDVGQRSAGLNFSDPGLLLDAACQGLGIALVSELLAGQARLDGKLAPLSETLVPGPVWNCLLHVDSERMADVRRFHQWLEHALDAAQA